MQISLRSRVMQISLRSHLFAGVAALGVTAVAVTPLAQPDLTSSIQRVSAAVELSAFANPVTVLLETIQLSTTDIFWQAQLPAPEDLYWPDSFYNEDFTFQYTPGYWGLGPDIVNQISYSGSGFQSSGLLSAALSNVSGYIDSAIYGATALVGGVADSVFNVPFALIAAAQLALAGNIPAAIAELQTQILDPLLGGVNGAIQGFGWAIDNIIDNAQTVLTQTVPRLVNDSIGFVLGSGTYLLQNVIGTATAILTSLAGLNIEGAWNAAVEGLLGYDGILGSIEQLTVGIGIVQDVDYDGDVVPTVVYPSVRSTLTSNAQRLGDFGSFGDGGIRNGSFVPAPAAAVQAAPAAAASKATEVAEVAEVTGVEVQRPTADSGSAAVTAAVTESPSGRDSADDGAVAPVAEKPAKGDAARKGGRGAR